MHRSILGGALALIGATALGAAPASEASSPAAAPCPAAGAALVERFISADCVACWAAAGTAVLPRGRWLFDWITPAGDDAPLSAAALVAAQERALRSGAPPLAAMQRSEGRAAFALRPDQKLSVESGPAWRGYFAVQLHAAGRWPAGASGWMALVELLPAGTDGSATARQLLRVVSGPLALQVPTSGPRLSHLAALRWPDNARPERLQARAWIEDREGRILAVAADRCSASPA